MHNTLEAARRSSTKGVRRTKEARFTWSGLSRIKQSIEVFGGSSKRALEKKERRIGRVLDCRGRRDKKTRFASD